MKLVANIKLCPTTEQEKALRHTLETCNAACNWLSQVGWEARVLRQYDLHKLAYHEARDKFGLSAQMTVRSIAKVADSYKTDKKHPHTFRKHSAQPYDDRIFRFCGDDIVSIWTLEGRQKIAVQMGDRQRELLKHRKGEVDLLLVRGSWYMACVCDIDEPALIATTDVLGVDMGIVNLATDSEGNNYSGKAVQQNHRKMQHRRKNLQKKETRSAKRKLKSISGKQKRYQKDTNHGIAKRIVQTAQRSDAAIALEDLKGITSRVKARRRQRGQLHNWQFFQLRCFIEYKARLAGIPVVLVDPKHTSQTCPSCGEIAKTNRKTRDDFKCGSCGLAGLADHIAALNIRDAGIKARAAVNRPMVTGRVVTQHRISSVTSLAPLGRGG